MVIATFKGTNPFTLWYSSSPASKMEHLLDALARKAEKRFPNAMRAASAQALDQDDAEAEEGRRFKQVDMIDEIRIECRQDKDHPDDPLE